MAQARLREALNAGSGSQKEKGPPVADGILSVTPDTQEALEWRSRRSIIDSAGTSSSYLGDETGRDSSQRHASILWVRSPLCGVSLCGDVNNICMRHLQGPSRQSYMANSPGKLRTSLKSTRGSFEAPSLK